MTKSVRGAKKNVDFSFLYCYSSVNYFNFNTFQIKTHYVREPLCLFHII